MFADILAIIAGLLPVVFSFAIEAIPEEWRRGSRRYRYTVLVFGLITSFLTSAQIFYERRKSVEDRKQDAADLRADYEGTVKSQAAQIAQLKDALKDSFSRQLDPLKSSLNYLRGLGSGEEKRKQLLAEVDTLIGDGEKAAMCFGEITTETCIRNCNQWMDKASFFVNQNFDAVFAQTFYQAGLEENIGPLASGAPRDPKNHAIAALNARLQLLLHFARDLKAFRPAS